jgi:protein kinase A
VKFPRNFDRGAKSLVKHLLVADLSKRFGNLKGGAKDIKCHRFFKKLVWDHLIQKKLPAPYKPPIKFVLSAFV